MKLLITALLLITNLNLSAQSNNFAGDYISSLGDTEGKHIIEYKLILNQYRTFVFLNIQSYKEESRLK